MPPSARIVIASCNYPWIVIVACAVLGVLAAMFAARHFAMTTDSLDLMSADLRWRQNLAAFNAAFPRQSDVIVVFVEGATPELAERAAGALTAALPAPSALFSSVRRPDG